MKKNKNTIYKRIFFIVFIVFINFNLFAQRPFYKKGKWGVDFGLNYYCPVIDGYSYSDIYPVKEDYDITLTGNVGKYLGISRTIRLYKINEKNLLNLLVGLSYNERKATLKYSGTKTVNGTLNQENGVEKIINQYPCLDIKLSGIANLKEKYGVCNAIGFRTNFTTLHNTRIFCSRDEYYLTYSLGFLFYFKKINIMLSINHPIFNLTKSDKFSMLYLDYGFKKKYFNTTNFGVSIFFNKPFKNKKNEEK